MMKNYWKLRVEKAKEIFLFKTDIAILLLMIENLENFQIEEHWYNLLRDKIFM